MPAITSIRCIIWRLKESNCIDVRGKVGTGNIPHTPSLLVPVCGQVFRARVHAGGLVQMFAVGTLHTLGGGAALVFFCATHTGT